MALTIRISPSAHAILRRLAEEEGAPMTDLLDRAIEAYRRQVFLEGLNADFAALRTDPEVWAQEQAERQEWDATLADGLE